MKILTLLFIILISIPVYAKSYSLELESKLVPSNSSLIERIDLITEVNPRYLIWFLKLDKWIYSLPNRILVESDLDLVEFWDVGYTKNRILFTRIIKNESKEDKMSYSWKTKIISKEIH